MDTRSSLLGESFDGLKQLEGKLQIIMAIVIRTFIMGIEDFLPPHSI
jgi:hypothetical protein